MENFDIRSLKIDEDGYYDFVGLEDDNDLWGIDELGYYMLQVKEMKKIILKDFRRILENKICYLKNNKGLVNYIECLLSTYQDSIIDTFYGVNNFIVMTDNYLCFNNVISDVDGYLFGVFGNKASSCEMVVIVDRSFKEYYFVMMDTSIVNGKVRTVVNKFSLLDDKVVSKEAKFNGYFEFEDYSEEGIKKKLRSINI